MSGGPTNQRGPDLPVAPRDGRKAPPKPSAMGDQRNSAWTAGKYQHHWRAMKAAKETITELNVSWGAVRSWALDEIAAGRQPWKLADLANMNPVVISAYAAEKKGES